MALDDLVLRLQGLVDRFIRRIRLGAAPPRAGRRLLVVQVDGLSRSVLEQALAERRMPFLGRLLKHGYCLQPMSVGLPTSTPAFQMAAFYGVRPDIPGFHYHDKRRGEDVYFPRAGDAGFVQRAQAADRLGLLSGGSSYGCVFTGGATDNLFNFAVIKSPTPAGLLRAVSAFVVLAWVGVKGLVLSVVELTRAVLRFLADPVAESRRGWKWLAIKVGVSVWVRQFFTLAVSRDIYRGVPAIYVNYLDYDVVAHEWGPRHRRAMRALRHVDSSLRQIWRVHRRVPEHRYDFYVLSDHGQALCTPYQALSGGIPLEERLFEEFFDPPLAAVPSTGVPRVGGLRAGLSGYRGRRERGIFQRFVNYLERDFPWVLGEVKEARERHGVRVVAAGPNAFVYFLHDPAPLTLDAIDERFPGIADEISRAQGIGFLLARSGNGPVCLWRGKRYRLEELREGPFSGRTDIDVVVAGIRDLMAMPCAGDLVIYGINAPQGNVSFINEYGAHAGPTEDELHTFIVHPPHVALPSPLRHPVQLYEYLIGYRQETPGTA